MSTWKARAVGFEDVDLIFQFQVGLSLNRSGPFVQISQMHPDRLGPFCFFNRSVLVQENGERPLQKQQPRPGESVSKVRQVELLTGQGIPRDPAASYRSVSRDLSEDNERRAACLPDVGSALTDTTSTSARPN